MCATEKTHKIEDRLGKLAMVAIFEYFGYRQLVSLISVVQNRDLIPLWGLAICSLVMCTAFMGLILYFTMTRLPPRESAAGIMPRVVAVAGTFFMTLLIVIPPQAVASEIRILSSAMIIAGSAMSIYCLRQLGRSFSIMATSRALKSHGAYNIVRHPLYGSEVLMMAGIVLGHGTVLAFGLGAVWLVIQLRRARYEEAVLGQTFPEYADYAARVPMLIPGLRLNWKSRQNPSQIPSPP